MRSFIVLAAIFISVCFLWVTSGYWDYSREDYVTEKVLELSAPFDVKIDIEFLKELSPADE